MKTPQNSAPPHTTSSLDANLETHGDRLIEVLDTLEDRVRRQNSLRYTFLRGVVYGFGTVIGATVLVALFGGFIATTINSFTNGSILTETLETNR